MRELTILRTEVRELQQDRWIYMTRLTEMTEETNTTSHFSRPTRQGEKTDIVNFLIATQCLKSGVQTPSVPWTCCQRSSWDLQRPEDPTGAEWSYPPCYQGKTSIQTSFTGSTAACPETAS
ncbi:hypothetical protein ABVT39_019473 [Epinephelus coioides]